LRRSNRRRNFRELRRDRRLVEEERVVGLDVETAQREVRRAAERTNSLAVPPHDEDLVVLLAAEVHALPLRPGRKQPGEGDRFRAGLVRLFCMIVDDRPQPPAEPFQSREDIRLLALVNHRVERERRVGLHLVQHFENQPPRLESEPVDSGWNGAMFC
jgi:hypothetical protein